MQTFRLQGAQGDCWLRRIDVIPSSAVRQPPTTDGTVIVSHSETGHHHYLAAIGVAHFTAESPLVAYLRCEQPSELLHARPHDTHESLLLAPGCYEVRRAREHTPAGWRRVED